MLSTEVELSAHCTFDSTYIGCRTEENVAIRPMFVKRVIYLARVPQ